MATAKEIKATVRPRAGKGAARAVRREGRVPGVIYGGNEPPLTISLDDAELRQRIFAGRFLTSIYDVEIDGKKHRVIPRDFQLDPVRDLPVHVDFMRLDRRRDDPGAASRSTSSIPTSRRGSSAAVPSISSPIRSTCAARRTPFRRLSTSTCPASISIIRKHLSDLTLPPNVRPLALGNATLVTIVPPSGYAEEMKAAADAADCCRRGCRRCCGRSPGPDRSSGAAGAAPAPAAGGGAAKK